MGALDHSPGTPEQTTEKWRLNLLAHFVCLQDEAGRSIAHSYLARGTLLLCLGIQIYCRLFGNSMSVLSEILTSGFAEVFLLALILIPTLITAFFIWTCFVPSGRRLQKWAIDSGLPHILIMIYAGLQTLNALLVAPISLAIFSRGLFWSSTSPGVYKGHTHEDLLGNMTPASVALFYVMIVPSILSLAATLSYGSFGISMLRSNEFLSASNRIPFLLFALGFFLTLICNMVTFNIQGPMFSMGTGIFLNIISLAASLLSIVVSGHYTVFYHRSYRTIAMGGAWMLLVSTLFDMIYTGQDRKGSMQIALISFTVFAFGSRLISNWDHHIEIVDPESEYISLRTIISLEQAFHEHRLGSAMMKSIMIRVQTFLKNQVDPSKRDQVFKSSSELETSNQDLVAMYLFTLFDQASRNSSKMDFMVGFYFANFLSNQKTNYLYLAVLVRKLKDSELSFSEAFHVHRLETLITQSLKQKEIESSGTVHDDRRKMRSHSMQTNKTSLNLYKTVETIKLYEQLMKVMRKQIDLVVNFYEQLEQPTTWIVKLHETVEQINKGRVICADLFDRVDEASSTMQAFHILPYALFLEQTENNFEKGTELVKYYDSKTNMMFKHLGRSIRESLLENSITLVVEAEKGRIGNIVFTSRNMRQAFGPEVPDIDGQSLDLFFNPDMAKVHQMEMERFLAKLDREYLGYRQQRYITFGNSIYYRVTVVTKFVPHIEEGFRLVLLIKNLSLDLVDANPTVMNNVAFAVDENFSIVGVGYNKNLLREDYTLNPMVEALIGQPLEVVSPESKTLLDAYLQVINGTDDPKLKALAHKKLLLAAVGERRYRKFFNRDDILTGATGTHSNKVDKTQTRLRTSRPDDDAQEGEVNIEDDEVEQQMEDLEEEVQNLKAGISGESFPPAGSPVTLQLVNVQQETIDPSSWTPEITIIPAKARLQLMRMKCGAMITDWDNQPGSKGRRKQPQFLAEDVLPSTSRDLQAYLPESGIREMAKSKLVSNLVILSLSLEDRSITEDLSSLNKPLLVSDRSHQVVGLAGFPPNLGSTLQTDLMKEMDEHQYRSELQVSEYEPEKETAQPGVHLKAGESTLRSSLNSLPSLKQDQPGSPQHLTAKKPNLLQEAFLTLNTKLKREGNTPKPSLSRRGSASPPVINEESRSKEEKSHSSELNAGQAEGSGSQKHAPTPSFTVKKPTPSKEQAKPSKQQKEQTESLKRYLTKMYEQKLIEDKTGKPHFKDVAESLVVAGEHRMPKKSVFQLQISLATQSEGKKQELGTEQQKPTLQNMKTTLQPVVKELNVLFGRSSSNNNGEVFHEGVRHIENNQKSNSRSVNRSKQQDLLGNNPQAAKKQEAVLDQGSMRSSNRTSHTGSRSHLVIRRIMKNPKINRLPQLSICVLLSATICLTHVFQELLRINFATTFDEVNSLQHVFATLVSMDCYYKGSLVNVLESQINLKDYGMYPDRYKFLDPDLDDIQAESVKEFEYHITNAERQHNKLLLGIQDLDPSNIDKFVTADLDLEVRIPEPEYKIEEATALGNSNNMNPIQISLLIMYDLHVWWDNRELYGDWGSYNFYYYAVQSWLQSVEEVFDSFNGASLDTIEYLRGLSIYLLIAFSLLTQSLIGLLYFQARTIRRGMIGTMKNLENLRMFEINTKQDRLRYLKNILEGTDDLEAHRRKVVSILRGMRNQRFAQQYETSHQAPSEKLPEEKKLTKNPTKVITNRSASQVQPKAPREQVLSGKLSTKEVKIVMPQAKPGNPGVQVPNPGDHMIGGSLNTPSTDRRHITAMYKMKRDNKDSSYMLGNKIKILPSQWMGLGALLIGLILIVEFQVGLNLLTSDRQRSSSVSYTNWMNVNRDYFLYMFYLNNLEAVIYIDSAGDMDLIELVPDLNDLVQKYLGLQKLYSSKLISEIRGMDAQTRQFGFTKFFSNPCDYLGRTIYDVDFQDCLKFGGGVIGNGYLNFMDYTRILVEQVKDNFDNEAVTGQRISNTTAFLSFVYFNKVINRPMFEIVREEMIQASDNVNDTSDAFVDLFGTTFQSILSAIICVLFFFLMKAIDYHTGLCYSIFLLLPEETYTINHYIRGFIKRLDG